MAGETPNPAIFSSWEEAFQYPLPAVRGMERQLRQEIESNKERLRSLVGASYRDLLDTAETVINMDKGMRRAEGYLGVMGQNCNTRTLQRKTQNFGSWDEATRGAANSARTVLASQLAVLRTCPDVVSRLLQQKDAVLIAAKILVISRLLHSKLSKQKPPVPFLETLRTRLSSLRRKLLSRIERRFRTLGVSHEALLEAMCAFALATSSSLSDVTKHFQNVRLQEISRCVERKEDDGTGSRGLLRALRLYVATIKETQNLIPAQLANALTRLRKISLVQNQDVCALVELNLDIHAQSLGEDISLFTPYIRQDDLSKSQSEKSLRTWTRLAIKRFLDGLKNRIKHLEDPLELLRLRRDILELWLSQQQVFSDVDSDETLDGLREVFRVQAFRLINSRASSLNGLSSLAEALLENWTQEKDDNKLWHQSILSIEVNNGGKRLRQTVIERLSGKTKAIQKISSTYTEWLQEIKSIEEMIKQLRDSKWDDFVDDIEDDDDALEDKRVLLNEDDPREIEETLSEALRWAFDKLQDSLLPSDLLLRETANLDQKAVFLLRLWREIRQNLPSNYKNPNLGRNSFPDLHRAINEAVINPASQLCSKRLIKFSRSSKLITRPLWEGDPELPLLPSPWIYRLLLEVHDAMTELGSDIWSPDSTNSLKSELAAQSTLVTKRLDAHEAVDLQIASNGHANGNDTVAAQTASSDQAHDSDLVDNNGLSPSDHIENTSQANDNDGNKQQDQPEEEEEQKAPTYPNGSPSESFNNTLSTNPKDLPKDRTIQLLFDLLYLSNATTPSSSTTATRSNIAPTTTNTDIEPTAATSVNRLGPGQASLKKYIKSLETDVELDDKSIKRMRKDAEEYWKRTRLIFGLL